MAFGDLFGRQYEEQWAMSAADNIYGMSLPEYHPQYTSIPDDFYSKKEESTIPTDVTTFDPSIAFAANLPSMSGGRGASGGANPLDAFGNVLMGIKSEGDKAFKAGWGLKAIASAGELFTKLATYPMERANADRAYRNKKQDVSNQMLAIDNQVQYYKNQITDKFATTMARSSMLMAAKNLRVTAGNLLEQTKDAAYDATQDIKMLESNAELKKIALRSEAKQAKVSKDLTKKLMTTDLLGSAAKLGLVFAGGSEAGMKWGDLYKDWSWGDLDVFNVFGKGGK